MVHVPYTKCLIKSNFSLFFFFSIFIETAKLYVFSSVTLIVVILFSHFIFYSDVHLGNINHHRFQSISSNFYWNNLSSLILFSHSLSHSSAKEIVYTSKWHRMKRRKKGTELMPLSVKTISVTQTNGEWKKATQKKMNNSVCMNIIASGEKIKMEYFQTKWNFRTRIRYICRVSSIDMCKHLSLLML